MEVGNNLLQYLSIFLARSFVGFKAEFLSAKKCLILNRKFTENDTLWVKRSSTVQYIFI
jgi:hypothetical protein